MGGRWRGGEEKGEKGGGEGGEKGGGRGEGGEGIWSRE